jgi:hypothetical protein
MEGVDIGLSEDEEAFLSETKEPRMPKFGKKGKLIMAGFLTLVLGTVGIFGAQNFKGSRQAPVAAAENFDLEEVQMMIGGKVVANGNLEVNRAGDGVYELRSVERGRYELVWNRKIEPIFGADFENLADQTEIGDFANERIFENMEMPVLIFPTEAMIVAYFESDIKTPVLTREINKTTLILEKNGSGGETTGKVLVIKKNSLDEAERVYRDYVK